MFGSGTEKKEGQEEEEKEGKEDKMHSGGAVAANEDGKKESPATDKAAESPAAENKPLFSFSAFGSGGGFGSGTSPAFSFSSAGTPAGGTAKPFSFGSSLGTGGFGFGTGGMASFSSVGTQGWNTGGSKNGDKDDGDAGNEGEGEDDAESEVAVRKGDGVVQLEEVETCTGEENERCVFQVRAKLFTFGKPATEGKDDGDKKESEKEKAGAGCWNVAGIGNLKLNVPKADDHPGARPRIVMRRQKTFQVCLNTYLFETMLCDKAGPKDVRFTVRFD